MSLSQVKKKQHETCQEHLKSPRKLDHLPTYSRVWQRKEPCKRTRPLAHSCTENAALRSAPAFFTNTPHDGPVVDCQLQQSLHAPNVIRSSVMSSVLPSEGTHALHGAESHSPFLSQGRVRRGKSSGANHATLHLVFVSFHWVSEWCPSLSVPHKVASVAVVSQLPHGKKKNIHGFYFPWFLPNTSSIIPLNPHQFTSHTTRNFPPPTLTP